MTKKSNLFLRFVLPTFLFLFLFQSCRQELFENKDTSTAQDKSRLHWITKNQIIQNQALYSKIQSLDSSQKQGSSSEKTFTDEENNISVDIEKALVIENEKGKKTYTLFIDRKKPRVLENLVFSETETEELNMYVVSYDSILFKGNEIIESGNVKNYITLDFLGKKSVSDVFSKVVSCYDSQQVAVFVPGTLCNEGIHVYNDPRPCIYTGWGAASPAYWSTQYTFSVTSCDDGLPEHIFGTTPVHGGGGGWNGNPILPPNPCNKIKNYMNTQKFKQTFQTMTNPSVFDLDYEKVFYVSFPPNTTTGVEPSYVPADLPPCANEGTIMLPDTAYGLFHVHQNTTYCGGVEGTPVKVPSPVDFRTFINTLMPRAFNHTGSYSNAFSVITTSTGSYMLMYEGTDIPAEIDDAEYKKLFDEYLEAFKSLYEDNSNVTQIDLEALMVKFMNEKLNRPSIKVFRVTETSSVKLEYNSTDLSKPKETNCP